MDFKIDKLDDFILVKVQKEKLDTTVAPGLKSELVLLAGNNEKNILLDLSKCTYCDSSGLSAILVANRLCKNSDGVFVLAGLQPAVERLISVSQLNTVINIAPTAEDGIEVMRKSLQSK
ncbi:MULTISPECIES: STAS domain-containing protein [Marinilabiliaceae]|uniref:Anti-sigma factor antagonist n=2 Tax=Marinilabiliaceae TaxID=558415 RepID=A0A1T5HA77_9BACT|nr:MULTISPECIES: STAS domain-containing protein [Marinilabiliaceae]ASB50813.1 anti-anti-sigma factor [Alkalitalea saponilacus]TCO05961.1 anti-anti-sigma factor [Natronoflexus pectinivorans]SKC17451.1 anti-anti-sigma factor [Alkalitalea saponilacus]